MGSNASWRLSTLCPVPKGAALLRDVRLLHGGTPNSSDTTRFLPSVEFMSGRFVEANRNKANWRLGASG